MRIALHTGKRHSLSDQRLQYTIKALQTGIGNVEVVINPSLTQAFDIVHAHDLDALPRALLHRLMGSPHASLVYDAHEDWSVYTSSTKPYARFARYAECLMLPFVDGAISPCPAVTSRLAKTVKITQTILNCPELPPPSTEPKYPVFTVAYAGHIGPHRGYSQLIEAAKILNQQGMRIEYLLMGAGTIDIPDDLRLQFTATGQLPHAEMMKRLQRCHLGLILFDDTPNNRIALPHKLFEYLACGLPINATMHCAAIGDFLNEVKVGLISAELTANMVADAIKYFYQRPEEIPLHTANALAAAKNNYNAQVQAAKLTALYGRLICA